MDILYTINQYTSPEIQNSIFLRIDVCPSLLTTPPCKSVQGKIMFFVLNFVKNVIKSNISKRRYKNTDLISVDKTIISAWKNSHKPFS